MPYDFTPEDWEFYKSQQPDRPEQPARVRPEKIIIAKPPQKPKVIRLPLSPLQKKYREYKTRIESKNKEFGLSFEQFCNLVGQKCVYCDDAGGVIDRIDSGIGYTIANCQPCCKVCNVMKYTYSHDAFVKHINKIHMHLSR